MKKKLIGIVVLVLLICSTALALGLPPKYIETLDLFLAKLETYQNNSSYVQILDEFSTQLDALKPRYSSSGNVPAMIDYLVSGIEDLKNKKLATDVDDEFFTNINNLISNGLGSSTSSSTTSSSSGGGDTNSSGEETSTGSLDGGSGSTLPSGGSTNTEYSWKTDRGLCWASSNNTGYRNNYNYCIDSLGNKVDNSKCEKREFPTETCEYYLDVDYSLQTCINGKAEVPYRCKNGGEIVDNSYCEWPQQSSGYDCHYEIKGNYLYPLKAGTNPGLSYVLSKVKGECPSGYSYMFEKSLIDKGTTSPFNLKSIGFYEVFNPTSGVSTLPIEGYKYLCGSGEFKLIGNIDLYQRSNCNSATIPIQVKSVANRGCSLTKETSGVSYATTTFYGVPCTDAKGGLFDYRPCYDKDIGKFELLSSQNSKSEIASDNGKYKIVVDKTDSDGCIAVVSPRSTCKATNPDYSNLVGQQTRTAYYMSSVRGTSVGSCGNFSNLDIPTGYNGVKSCTFTATRSNNKCTRSDGVVIGDVYCPNKTSPSSSSGGSSTSSSTSSSGGNTSYTYSWNTGTYGTCSSLTCTTRGSRGTCDRSCGGGTQYRSCTGGTGTQTRNVYCKRSDGTQVSDSYCSSAGIKPSTTQSCSGNPGGQQSQSCSTQACQATTVTCPSDGKTHNTSLNESIISVYKEMGRSDSEIRYDATSLCWANSLGLSGTSLRCNILKVATEYNGSDASAKALVPKAFSLYNTSTCVSSAKEREVRSIYASFGRYVPDSEGLSFRISQSETGTALKCRILKDVSEYNGTDTFLKTFVSTAKQLYNSSCK